MTVVFVCTGNTCRSPMAEALMRRQLRRRGIGASVTSAGLFANGAPIADNAAAALAEVGLDMTRHRSRPLTDELIAAADLVVAMTDDHRRLLIARGVPREKIALLQNGIADPYGGDMTVYRRCRDEIDKAVGALANDLFSGDRAVTVLPMTAAHIPALAALERVCFSTPWSEDALREELTNPAAHFAVAVEGGEAVGYMGVLAAADEGFVTNIAVRPDCRRRGIAAALIAHQAAWAKAAGLRRLALEVRRSNTAAIALYERAGFQKDGVRPRFYSEPTEDAVLYSLYLEGETNEHIGI